MAARLGKDRRGFGTRGLGGLVVTTLLAVAGPGTLVGADEGFRCALRDVRGVPQSDAETAVELLCGELRKASAGSGAYSVDLRTLGELVIVTAEREAPAASVTVQVHGVEEILTAAPRIADALVRGLGFSTTQRVDNLLVEETRQPRVKKGAVKFSAGVADVESLGFGARSAGFSLGLMYSTPRFALPAELRLAWNDGGYPDGKSLDVFSISVGGRAFFSKKDVAPFLGAGLGFLSLSAYEYSSEAYSFGAERLGVAPYVEAGVEMLRLHRGRIALVVRADLPLGSLESPEIVPYSYPDWDGVYGRPGYSSPGRPAESRYVVPVSIGVTVAF
jgi:hypothetical protein